MDWLILVASSTEPADLWQVILLSILGGGGAAAGSSRLFRWAARRKHKSGKYGWKWGTWFAVVDLEDLEARVKAAEEEAAKAKAESAKEMERARAIVATAEAKWAKADALIAQCQDHTELALRERDRLALQLANDREDRK